MWNTGKIHPKLYGLLKFSERLQQILWFLEMSEALCVLHVWAHVLDTDEFNQNKSCFVLDFSAHVFSCYSLLTRMLLISPNEHWNLFSICNFPLLWKAKRGALLLERRKPSRKELQWIAWGSQGPAELGISKVKEKLIPPPFPFSLLLSIKKKVQTIVRHILRLTLSIFKHWIILLFFNCKNYSISSDLVKQLYFSRYHLVWLSNTVKLRLICCECWCTRPWGSVSVESCMWHADYRLFFIVKLNSSFKQIHCQNPNYFC